jgi:vacuolar-type H+-ATPase subunit H
MTARPGDEVVVMPSSPGISSLLEAEKRADEITLRAREEAERIVADARKRADEIRGGEGSGPENNDEAARMRQEADAEKARIARETQLHIERIRKLAESRRAEALDRLVKALFAQS